MGKLSGVTRTHALTRTHMHTHTHKRARTRTSAHTHTCTHAHTYTSAGAHARTHPRAHTHARTHVHTCTRTHTQTQYSAEQPRRRPLLHLSAVLRGPFLNLCFPGKHLVPIALAEGPAAPPRSPPVSVHSPPEQHATHRGACLQQTLVSRSCRLDGRFGVW